MPLHRLGTTDDIASVVRFLAGPESSWITGVCISADGGHHLRRGPNLEGVMRMVFGDGIAPAGAAPFTDLIFTRCGWRRRPVSV